MKIHHFVKDNVRVYPAKANLTAATRAFQSGRKRGNKYVAVVVVIVTTIWVTGCLSVKPIHSPDFSRHTATQQTGKSPIIIVPGIMGSTLINKKTNQEVWPKLNPKDADLMLPISPDLKSNRSDVVATEVIGSAKLAALFSGVNVYQALANTLVKDGGYKLGNIDDPLPDGDRDTVYLFAYDWRRDNVESAQLLADKIANLKQKLGRPDLKFDIVAHSTGGLISRYYLMYGGAVVAGHNDAKVPWAGSASIDRLILISAPNEGATEVFRTLVEGYRLIGGTVRKILRIRKIPPNVLFTMPAVYQLLPHPGTEKFYDSQAQPIAVNLYDVETWRRFRWGIFDPGGRSDYHPTAEQETFLKAVLDRAMLFDQALDKKYDPGIPSKIFVLAGDCRPTPAAVFVIEQGGQSKTVFSPHGISGSGLSKTAIHSLMFEPGDGRVTRPSAVGASKYAQTENVTLESYLTGSDVVFGCGSHTNLLNNKTLADALLVILVRRTTPNQGVGAP